MTTVNLERDYAVSAAEVWAVIGEFESLHSWHPQVVDSEISDGGTLRTLTLAEGKGQVQERLVLKDDANHSYSYAIISGPLPVSNYSATLSVVDLPGGGCRLTWTSAFSASGEEGFAKGAIAGIYEDGAAALAERFPA
ncbi:SRPBCC family protein [Rhodovibrionaceae bacterium A322]